MTLQIEEGKFYRTRNGRKAGPAEHRAKGTSEVYPWSVPTNSTDVHAVYMDDGRYQRNGHWPEHDLIAEWVDEPIVNTSEMETFGELPDIKATILDQAGKIVNGARRSAYGTPENNFERIARFWQAYFENRGLTLRDDNGHPHAITAVDVSPMMRLMKEARLCETPDHYDSFVDIVGYTLTGAEVNRVKSA